MRIGSTCTWHVAILQRVLESAPDYYLILRGHGPEPDEAQQEVAAVPDGFPVEQKFF